MAVTCSLCGLVPTARYGRVVAFVRVGDSQQAIQEILIAQGQARVEARIGDKACADILLRSERVARAARRGL
jgi:endonuclease YncB( thermonuclease family)